MNNIYIKFIIGILFLAGPKCYAQYSTKQIDSIYSAASNSINLSGGSRYATIVYHASKEINYNKGVVEGLVLFAKNNTATGHTDTAFKYITQAENAAIKINDPVLNSNILIFKGVCYLRLGFYKEADQTLNSAIPVVKTIDNKEEIHYYLTAIYTDLALNNEHSGNVKAKDFWGGRCYNESLQLEKSKKYQWVSAIAASNRGNKFTLLKQYDSAEVYLNKALLLANEYSDQYKYNKNYTLWVISLHAGDLYYAEKNSPNQSSITKSL